jgi:hypothetical protein
MAQFTPEPLQYYLPNYYLTDLYEFVFFRLNNDRSSLFNVMSQETFDQYLNVLCLSLSEIPFCENFDIRQHLLEILFFVAQTKNTDALIIVS